MAAASVVGSPESDATPRPNANAATATVTAAATITAMSGRPVTPALRIEGGIGWGRQLVMSLVEKLAHAKPRKTTMYAA